jgi:hypothetical protein
MIHATVQLVHTGVVLVVGALPALWRSCEVVVAHVSLWTGGFVAPYSHSSQVLTSLLFFVLYLVYRSVLVVLIVSLALSLSHTYCGGCSTSIELPFSVYSTFVIEEKFGFNKQSVAVRCACTRLISTHSLTHSLTHSPAPALDLCQGSTQSFVPYAADCSTGSCSRNQVDRVGRSWLLVMYGSGSGGLV